MDRLAQTGGMRPRCEGRRVKGGIEPAGPAIVTPGIVGWSYMLSPTQATVVASVAVATDCAIEPPGWPGGSVPPLQTVMWMLLPVKPAPRMLLPRCDERCRSVSIEVVQKEELVKEIRPRFVDSLCRRWIVSSRNRVRLGRLQLQKIGETQALRAQCRRIACF